MIYWINLAILMVLAYLMIRSLSKSLQALREEHDMQDHYDEAISLTQPEPQKSPRLMKTVKRQMPLDDQPSDVIRKVVNDVFGPSGGPGKDKS